MTSFEMHGVNLSRFQIEKLRDARNKNQAVKIRLNKNSLHGEHRLPLTQRQINKIMSAKAGIDLELSSTQLQYLEKTGGFFPLLALIPALLGGLSAAGAVTGGIAAAVSAAKNAKALTEQTTELARHNAAIESQLKASSENKSGTGVISNFVGK